MLLKHCLLFDVPRVGCMCFVKFDCERICFLSVIVAKLLTIVVSGLLAVPCPHCPPVLTPNLH